MLPSVSFATRNKQKPPGSARPVRRREWDPEEELGRPETTRMAGYTHHQTLAAPARPGMRRRAHGEMGPGAWGAVWFPEGTHRRDGEGDSHTRTHARGRWSTLLSITQTLRLHDQPGRTPRTAKEHTQGTEGATPTQNQTKPASQGRVFFHGSGH